MFCYFKALLLQEAMDALIFWLNGWDTTIIDEQVFIFIKVNFCVSDQSEGLHRYPVANQNAAISEKGTGYLPKEFHFLASKS